MIALVLFPFFGLFSIVLGIGLAKVCITSPFKGLGRSIVTLLPVVLSLLVIGTAAILGASNQMTWLGETQEVDTATSIGYNFMLLGFMAAPLILGYLTAFGTTYFLFRDWKPNSNPDSIQN